MVDSCLQDWNELEEQFVQLQVGCYSWISNNDTRTFVLLRAHVTDFTCSIVVSFACKVAVSDSTD